MAVSALRLLETLARDADVFDRLAGLPALAARDLTGTKPGEPLPPDVEAAVKEADALLKKHRGLDAALAVARGNPKRQRVEVECAYCLTVCKVRQIDLIEAESIAEVICKECLKQMLKRYRKTGIWGPP